MSHGKNSDATHGNSPPRHLGSTEAALDEYLFALRGLTYFDDAEDDPMPEMLVPMTWDDVKLEIERKVRAFIKEL